MRLLWKGTLRKTLNKMPRGREKNVSIVAFLTPKGKGNPETQELLKVIKSKNINKNNPLIFKAA